MKRGKPFIRLVNSLSSIELNELFKVSIELNELFKVEIAMRPIELFRVYCFAPSYTGDEDPPSLSPNDWLGEVVDRRGDERSRVFPNLKNAFRTAVEQFGPNDFFVSKHAAQQIALRHIALLLFD